MNTLRPRQNDTHFADDIFKSIFFYDNYIQIKISLKFVLNSPIKNNTLFNSMALCQTGNKSLSEPMVALFTDAYMHHVTSIN